MCYFGTQIDNFCWEYFFGKVILFEGLNKLHPKIN